jgi:cell pole-organizing protein PopZ
MSKLDAIGAKSLEEILASIRKTLSGGGSDPSSGQRAAAPMPAPATPEPRAPADRAGDDDGLLSARLAGALGGPVNGAALDDDFSELLAPEHKEPAPSDPASAAKPAAAGSDGQDPLWFLKQPSAAGESNGTQAPTAHTQPGELAPAPADEVKLSRPEVLRASLPPLFGAAEERPTIFRTAPAHAPKAPDSGAPTAKMQPPPPPPGEVGKTAAGSVHTARTQPSMPSVQPADETAKAAPPPSVPPKRTDAGSSEAMPTAPVAREPAPIREAAPAPAAEAAPGPQPLPEAKPANGSLGDVAADTTANKVSAPTREPSATKPAPTADAPQARSLEQVVGELLEPVIRHWLETNLPRMVEKVVRDEVARALAAERRAAKA